VGRETNREKTTLTIQSQTSKLFSQAPQHPLIRVLRLLSHHSGPGGHILIITSTNSTNPFGSYYTEILRNEGFNAFQVADISTVTALTLSAYDIVILTEMTLNTSHVALLSDWAAGGGRLIAMRPDSKLAGLLASLAHPARWQEPTCWSIRQAPRKGHRQPDDTV